MVGLEKKKKNHNIGFWPGAKLLNAAVSVDVASAFTKTCKLLSRQNIDKQKNPSLQIVMRALKVSGGCGQSLGREDSRCSYTGLSAPAGALKGGLS